MAWFSNVNLGNLGDLGDIAGSLNKLATEGVKGFDIEDFLATKEGAEGTKKDPGSQPVQAGGAQAAPASVSIWDSAFHQTAKADGVAGSKGEGTESFIPLPIPSLFGQALPGVAPSGEASHGQKEPSSESTVSGPHPESQSHVGKAPEGGPPRESSQGENDKEEGEGEGEGEEAQADGWGIEEDIISPTETEGESPRGEEAHEQLEANTEEPTAQEEADEEEEVEEQVEGEEGEAQEQVEEEEPQETKASTDEQGEEQGGQEGHGRPDGIPGTEQGDHDDTGEGQEAEVAEAEGASEKEGGIASAANGEEEQRGGAEPEGLPGSWGDDDVEVVVEEEAPQEGSTQEEPHKESQEGAVQSVEGGRHADTAQPEDTVPEADAQVDVEGGAQADGEGESGGASERGEGHTAVVAEQQHSSTPAGVEQPALASGGSEPAGGDEEGGGISGTGGASEGATSGGAEEVGQPEEGTLAGQSSGRVGGHAHAHAHENGLHVGEAAVESREMRVGEEAHSPGAAEDGPATHLTNHRGEEPAAVGGPECTAAREPVPGALAGPAESAAEKGLASNVGTAASEATAAHAEAAASAAHAALAAALAVSSPEGRPLVGNHVAPLSLGGADSSAELLALREQLRQMEVAVQNAAQQAQVKADELAAMMQENDDLKAQLADEKTKKSNEAELEALREEYQHRLGAAERKVYALTKERDMLRREQSRKSDTSTLLKEKDEIIKQVMAEGEELSKKQAAQEAAMKKLRTQLREVEEEKQRLQSRLQVEEARVESIKKDKAATEKALQDAVERSHAELAAQKDFYHTALAQAKDALLQAEARADSEAKADMERKVKEAGERERVLLMTVEELRQALTRTEQQAAFREQLLRKDLEDMEARCQAAESRHEELVARMPDSTRPLLRQIEAMQESTNMRVEALTGVERALNARLNEAEAKAALAEERERASNERLTQTLSRLAVMEAQLSCLRAEQAQLARSLEKERQRATENRTEYLTAQEASAAADTRVKQLETELKDLKARARKDLQEERSKREAVEQELESERATVAEYERKFRAEGRSAAEKALAAAHAAHGTQGAPATLGDVYSGSMVYGLRRNASNSSSGSASASAQGEASILAASLSESLAAAQASLAAAGVPASKSVGVGMTGRGATMVPAAALDQVEALLRQKDGELSTYVARIATLESTRDSLAEELVKSTSQVEQLKAEVSSLPRMRAELEALRRRHASALELMGERDEQVEELRADLLDVKEMYREQVDLLVGQIERLSKSINTNGT